MPRKSMHFFLKNDAVDFNCIFSLTAANEENVVCQVVVIFFAMPVLTHS